MKLHFLKILVSTLFIFNPLEILAKDPPRAYFKNLESGWSQSNYAVIPKSQNPNKIIKEINNKVQTELLSGLKNFNKVSIISYKGIIIGEVIKPKKEIKPGGNSITKSILSLAIGKAHCDGKLNIQEKAFKYSKLLTDTSWGNSTIEQLLMMSSGANKVSPRFMGHKDEQMQKNAADIIWKRNNLSNAEAFLYVDEKYQPPGKKMIYSTSDSIALSYVLEGATNKPLHIYLKKMWDEIGSNYDANFLLNSRNEPVAHSGFAANPYDYVALGNYVLDSLKKDDCYGNYLRKAITTKIDNPSFTDNRNYGYHIWTDCMFGNDAFCFVGGFGQFLLMYPEKDTVLFIHSTSSKWGGYLHWSIITEKISKLKNKIEPTLIMKSAYISLNLEERKRFQEILKDYGYNSKVDGIWGSGTQKALNKFVISKLGKEVFKSLTLNEFKKYILSKI
ncbi:MAG: serine hydrolase [Paracoccaceae bacterium]